MASQLGFGRRDVQLRPEQHLPQAVHGDGLHPVDAAQGQISGEVATEGQHAGPDQGVLGIAVHRVFDHHADGGDFDGAMSKSDGR